MEKRIGDLMSPISCYPKLLTTHTFKDVVAVLTAAAREGNSYPLAIIYENNVPAGLIGFGEILKVIEPGYLKEKTYRGWSCEPWLLPVFLGDLFSQRCREVYKKKVKDFMQPITYAVSPRDPLIKAIYLMVRYNLEAMLVKDGERFAGIIRRPEIFREIAGLIDPGLSAEAHVAFAN